MELPTKIRLKILYYLLRAPTDLHFYDDGSGPFDASLASTLPDQPQRLITQMLEFRSRSHLSSQFLRCCKTLRDEEKAVWYGENRLYITIRAYCYSSWREQLTDAVLFQYLSSPTRHVDRADDGHGFIARFNKLRLVLFSTVGQPLNRLKVRSICCQMQEICWQKMSS